MLYIIGAFAGLLLLIYDLDSYYSDYRFWRDNCNGTFHGGILFAIKVCDAFQIIATLIIIVWTVGMAILSVLCFT